jgi:hypothetical protein
VNLNIGKFANNIGGGSTIKKVSIGAQGANAASAATGDRAKLSAFLRPGQSVNAEKESQPRAAQDAEGDSTAKDEKQKQDKLTNEKPEDAGKTANKITKDFTKLALKNTEDKNAEGNKSTENKTNESSLQGNIREANQNRAAQEPGAARESSGSSLDNKAESNKPNISDIAGQVKDSRHPEQREGSSNSKTNNDLQYDNKAIENMGSNKDNRFGDAMKESPKSTSPEAVAKDYGFSTPDSASGAGSTPGMGGANGFGGGPGANQPPVTINNVNNNNVNPGMSQPQMTPPPQLNNNNLNNNSQPDSFSKPGGDVGNQGQPQISKDPTDGISLESTF